MRSLTPELLAAQKSVAAAPYLKAVASDRIGGIRRLAWSRLYTGAEPDGYHAARHALRRLPHPSAHDRRPRPLPARGHPGAGSNFSSRPDLDAAASADVALCAEGARVLIFYVDPAGLAIKIRESTDNGAILGSATTVVTAGSAVPGSPLTSSPTATPASSTPQARTPTSMRPPTAPMSSAKPCSRSASTGLPSPPLTTASSKR